MRARHTTAVQRVRVRVFGRALACGRLGGEVRWRTGMRTADPLAANDRLQGALF